MATKFNSKDCERVFNGYRKQVARFNSYLEDIIKQVVLTKFISTRVPLSFLHQHLSGLSKSVHRSQVSSSASTTGVRVWSSVSVTNGRSIARTVSPVRKSVR